MGGAEKEGKKERLRKQLCLDMANGRDKLQRKVKEGRGKKRTERHNEAGDPTQSQPQHETSLIATVGGRGGLERKASSGKRERRRV